MPKYCTFVKLRCQLRAAVNLETQMALSAKNGSTHPRYFVIFEQVEEGIVHLNQCMQIFSDGMNVRRYIYLTSVTVTLTVLLYLYVLNISAALRSHIIIDGFGTPIRLSVVCLYVNKRYCSYGTVNTTNLRARC